jgi:hypothetical protein
VKVWITKCALTKGIQQKEGSVSETNKESFSEVGNSWFSYWGNGREWHTTKESAIAKAEEMRVKKIASLKKQIAKLEKLKFGE